MSRYNRYPVSGMTNVQIYTGTVSIQYRDTTTYRYTAHPYVYVCTVCIGVLMHVCACCVCVVGRYRIASNT